MKYTEEIHINRPVDDVVSLFDSQESLVEWMEGLESFNHIDGMPGEVGARSKLVFKLGKREIEMIETITVRNLPDEFSGTYEADEVLNTLTNRFFKDGEDRTRMVLECEFEFRNLLMKIMGFIMPWAFRKQTRKNLAAFKAFAERS